MKHKITIELDDYAFSSLQALARTWYHGTDDVTPGALRVQAEQSLSIGMNLQFARLERMGKDIRPALTGGAR